MTPTHLRKVQRAARKAALARHGLNDAMRQAQAAGATLRTIAAAANISPESVRQRILEPNTTDTTHSA